MLLGLDWGHFTALHSQEDVTDALAFVELLTSRPDSHFAAELMGGQQHFGWSADRYIAADTRDLLVMIASGFAGERIGDPYPRPTSKEAETPTSTTIAEFSEAAFFGWLNT